MKLNRVCTILFVSLAAVAGSAHTDAIGSVADVAKLTFGGSRVNTGITIGTFTSGSNMDVRVGAQGGGSKAMADGIVTTGGGGGVTVNTKATLDVLDNSSVRVKVKAGDGAEAYTGDVTSANKNK